MYAYSIAKVQIATKRHTFYNNYNDHKILAMSGHCIATECNTTSNVGYCLKYICGHLLLLMYMAKIADGTTMSTYLPLIGLHKLCLPSLVIYCKQFSGH